MLEVEEWKDISGYEGRYQISSYGRIKSLPIFRKTKSFYVSKEKIRKCNIGTDGYLFVALAKDSVTKYYRINRLVALHFIKNPFNKDFVNHKDGDRLNNCVDNLEWVTVKENVQHAINTGLWNKDMQRHPKGKDHPSSIKVSKTDVFTKETVIFYSLGEASRAGFGRQSDISRAAKKEKEYKGYLWKVVGGD